MELKPTIVPEYNILVLFPLLYICKVNIINSDTSRQCLNAKHKIFICKTSLSVTYYTYKD